MTSNYCVWFGISCQEISGSREIVQINLSDNNLVGTIPSSIGRLFYLTRFDASINGLYGVIPDAFGVLGLDILLLHENAFRNNENPSTGIIPVDFCSSIPIITVDCLFPGFVSCPGNCCICNNIAPSVSPTNAVSDVPSSVPTSSPTMEASVVPSSAPTCISTIDPSYCDGFNLKSTCLVLIDIYEGLEGCNWEQGVADSSSGGRRMSDIPGNPWFSGTPSTNTIDPFCFWFGVACESGCSVGCDVVKIDLYENNLGGTIPTTVGLLLQLTDLELNQNYIQGTIPTELGQLSNLFVMLLHGNDITGTMPSEVCDISGLGALWSDCDDNFQVECDCCTDCGDKMAPSAPSSVPTLTDTPSLAPSYEPSSIPSNSPTIDSSILPSLTPTTTSSLIPTFVPTGIPSAATSTTPSEIPTGTPSAIPSSTPSAISSSTPSEIPTGTPSAIPSSTPSAIPSSTPSAIPSSTPSAIPSSPPSSIPSLEPTF